MMSKVTQALLVLVLDSKTRTYLFEHDRKALTQAVHALLEDTKVLSSEHVDLLTRLQFKLWHRELGGRDCKGRVSI